MTGRRRMLVGLGLLNLLHACAWSGMDPALVPGEPDSDLVLNTDPAGAPADGRLHARGSGSSLFFDARTGGRLSPRSLASEMAGAPIVMLGEVHDNLLHHRIRARLLLDWVWSRPTRPAALIFEHLDREHNDALRLAQGRAAEDRRSGGRLAALLDAGRFDRDGWGWPAHRALFEAAQASGATWIAANFSRASAQRLSREPGAREDPALQAVVESARWSEEAQRALAQALARGHCQETMPAAALERITRIQRLRDAALALPLLDASERRSMLLAGNGHVRRDHGVPLYLGALERQTVVVGFEEVTRTATETATRNSPGGQSSAGSDLARLVGATRAGELGRAYDVVCLTATPARQDPCAASPDPRATTAGTSGTALNPAVPTQTPSR